jgi:hypothetical protein
MDKKSNRKNNSTEKETEELSGFRFSHAFLIIVVLLLLLALFSHNPSDLAVLDGGYKAPIRNWIGPVGANISKYLLLYFGIAAFPLLIFAIICALRPLIPVETKRRGYVSAVIAVIIGISIIFGLFPDQLVDMTEKLGIGHSKAPTSALSGGVIGQFIAAPQNSPEPGIVRQYIGGVGTFIVGAVLAATGLFFIWLADWHTLFMLFLEKRRNAAEQENLNSDEEIKKKKKHDSADTEKDNKKSSDPDEKETSGTLSKIEKAKQLLKSKHKTPEPESDTTEKTEADEKPRQKTEIPEITEEPDLPEIETIEEKPSAPSSHAAPVITTESDKPKKSASASAGSAPSYGDYQLPPHSLLKKQPAPSFNDKDGAGCFFNRESGGSW